MSGKISQDTTVPFKSSIFFPGVDTSLGVGFQNVKLPLSALVSTALQPVTSAASTSAALLALGTAAIVTPQQFGAKADGATDDTAAIVAALAAASATGASVYFPGTAASYLVSSQITVTGPMRMFGDGDTSTVKTSHATASIFNLTGVGISISDMKLTNNLPRTAGASIIFSGGVEYIHLRRIHFVGNFNGIDFGANNVAVVDVTDCWFDGTLSTGHGVVIASSTAFDICFRHIIMDTTASPQPNSGLFISNCADVVLEDFNVIHHGADLAVAPAAGQTVGAIYATDCFFDTATDAGLKIFPNGGVVSNLHFKNCWFCNHSGALTGGNGIYISQIAASTIVGVNFTDCDMLGNSNCGLRIEDNNPAQQVLLNGCRVNSNAQAGVSIGIGVSGWSVVNSTVSANTTAGVFVAIGGSDHYVVANNQLWGNVANNFLNGGTGAHTIVTPNLTT